MLKVAIIGCGKITERAHLPELAAIPQVSVVALADANSRNLKNLADLYGVDGRYKDYREMLKEEEIDAVCVNTPNFLHAEMTVACCRAGKYVLVEKPVATSTGEVGQMRRAAEKAGVFVMVEQTHRFMPFNEKAYEIVKSGFLGKVIGFRGRVGSAGPENWSPKGKWFYKKAQAFGGALADIGIHIIDTVRWVSGKEIAGVKAFTAQVGRKGDVEDNAVLALRMTDGCVGVIEASWTQSPSYFGYDIICEKGTLENVMGRGLRARMSEPGGEVSFDVPKASVRGGPFKYFADCVLNRQKPFVDIDEGGRSLAVVLAGYKSAAEGREVKVRG